MPALSDPHHASSHLGRDHAHVLLPRFLVLVDVIRLSGDLLEVAGYVMQLRAKIRVLQYPVRLLLQESNLQYQSRLLTLC